MLNSQAIRHLLVEVSLNITQEIYVFSVSINSQTLFIKEKMRQKRKEKEI